jgi:hypothetical protein
MSELLVKYKDFWKQVKTIADDNGITGFHIVYSGAGDEGCIDEVNMLKGGKRRRLTKKQAAVETEIDTDEFGNEMRPHPWAHDDEVFSDLEDSKLVVPNVVQKREMFDAELGWRLYEFVGDLPLAEAVKKIGYAVTNAWFPGWEINEGSNGVLYLYPKYIEFEFTEYYEDESERGHKCYSETVKFQDFEDWDYDLGYRGKCVDEICNEDDE